jgi:hypothetical protein
MTHKKGATGTGERETNASQQQEWLKRAGSNHHSPERYANVFARFKHWLTYRLRLAFLCNYEELNSATFAYTNMCVWLHVLTLPCIFQTRACSILMWQRSRGSDTPRVERSGVRIPIRQDILLLSQTSRPTGGTHPETYSMNTGCSFLGVNRKGC